MSMDRQVSAVCRSAFAQLRNIGLIRQYLTSYATKSLINGLVTSRLDYCNALLYGVPQTLMHKLQRVQNCAARIVTRRSRFDHISPVLKDLHWLPVHRRVQFKTLLYTYKAIHKQAQCTDRTYYRPHYPNNPHFRKSPFPDLLLRHLFRTVFKKLDEIDALLMKHAYFT